MLRTTWLTSAALALLAFASIASAQTGSITPTSAQLEALPVEDVTKIQLIEESFVDLRSHLPSVGEQKINDCTAWAAAYAKSYAEAREQGWKPDSPSRIFSPSFLYNQVNRGQDKGSNILDVVKVMSSKGAATLASAPYNPKDFLTPPSLRAFTEASVFPIADAYRLTNRTAIRRALQRRSVVVIGTHVGPLFMGGRYAVYTRELFTKDDTLRQPGQPHGKHAMLIVGYDDSRNAFLIQNSWGTRWAQGGYCYVSYDLFDEIRPTGADKSDGVFCNWALVMNDIDEPLEADGNGMLKPRKVEFWELKPGGFADIRGFDAERKRFHYTFVATLKGPRELLAQVDSVAWRWNDETGTAQAQVSTDKAGRFVLVGTADTSPVKIAATVRRSDGEAFDIQGELPGQSPKAEFRSVTPVFKDKYWGRRNDGTPLFQVRATIDVPLAERSQVKEVIYTSNGKSSSWPGFSELTDYGPMTWIADTSFPVEAAVHYVDGGVKKVQFSPTITDDVFDGRRIIANSKKISQTADGRSVYAVTLTFDRPSRDDFKISRVEYYVGPQFAESRLISADTFGEYAVYLTTDRDFRVRMTVFEDFQGQTKSESIEQWISVGPDTRFAHPSQVELAASDRYIGRYLGSPIRRSVVKLTGDFKTLERVQRVSYKLPDHLEGKTVIVGKGESPTFDLLIDDSRPFIVQATADLDDGTTLPFTVSHSPSAPINDNLGFSITAEERPTFWIDATQPMRSQQQIRMTGAPNDLWKIRSVTYRGTLDGIPFSDTLELDRHVSPEDLLFGCAPRKLVELEAIVTDLEDFEQSLTVEIAPSISRDQRPTLALRVREKLWQLAGDGSSQPTWIARTDLVGTEAELGEIQSATISLTAIDAQTPYESTTLSQDFGKELAYLVSRPTKVSARLTMKDGSTRVLDALVRTETAPAAELALHVRQRVAYPDTVAETQIRISGHESTMRQIKSVAYQLAGEPQPVLVQERDSWESGGFARIIPGAAQGEVVARITMLDGSTRTLTGPASPRDRPIGYRVQTWPGSDKLGRVLIAFDGWPYLFAPYGWGNKVDLDYHSPKDWVAFPSNAMVFDAIAGTNINLSRVRAWYNGESIDLPGRVIEVPASITSLSAICTSHPTRENEWVARLVGPIDVLADVRAATYRQDGKPSPSRITQRWGETGEGFELRFFGTDPPVVSVDVEMRDGKTVSVPLDVRRPTP